MGGPVSQGYPLVLQVTRQPYMARMQNIEGATRLSIKI